MVDVAKRSLSDVEAVVWVVDATGGIRGDDQDIAGILSGSGRQTLIALNKIDAVSKGRLLPVIARLAELLPEREIVPISARTGGGNSPAAPGRPPRCQTERSGKVSPGHGSRNDGDLVPPPQADITAGEDEAELADGRRSGFL